jgi:TfoX/Sxy family transcriptional regulator of competence genes
MLNQHHITQLVTEALSTLGKVKEKKMFSGLSFMVDEKLCICLRQHDMLCRIGDQQALLELEKGHCRQMVHNGRIMKDFVFVEYSDLRNNQEVYYWVNLSLQFNPDARPSRRSGKKQG